MVRPYQHLPAIWRCRKCGRMYYMGDYANEAYEVAEKCCSDKEKKGWKA